MLVFEAKLEGTQQQYQRLDEAIRTARFVRNSCLRYWLDNLGIGKYELSAYCAVLAKEFPWAAKLNSQAVRLLLKELGLQLRGSTTTAKKQTREKRLSAL
jgi:transposase